MISRRRWLAGSGIMSATYLVLGGVRGLGTGDPQGALVYLAAAVVTFAFAATVLPIMVPRRRRGPDEPPGGGGPGGRSPDEPQQPPWWPEFEREFREHVRQPDVPDQELVANRS